MLPKLSLVVPSFNAVNTIRRTLDSILNQEYPNLELICVDGSSTDGTSEVMAEYGDLITHFVCEPDRCQADALNKGFMLASGDVYGWLCADDELCDGALASVADFFVAHPEVDILTGGCIRRFDDGEEYITTPGEKFFENLFLMNTIEQPSTFWRAHVHKTTGPLSEKLKYAFDWEFWCRMKAQGFKVSAIDTPLSIYYFSDSNLTSTGGRKIADEMFTIVHQYGPYRGMLAWGYAALYRLFDLRGFYDQDEKKSGGGLILFHATLRLLYLLFDRDSINAYNWNFASRQERGKGW